MREIVEVDVVVVVRRVVAATEVVETDDAPTVIGLAAVGIVDVGPEIVVVGFGMVVDVAKVVPPSPDGGVILLEPEPAAAGLGCELPECRRPFRNASISLIKVPKLGLEPCA